MLLLVVNHVILQLQWGMLQDVMLKMKGLVYLIEHGSVFTAIFFMHNETRINVSVNIKSVSNQPNSRVRFDPGCVMMGL